MALGLNPTDYLDLLIGKQVGLHPVDAEFRSDALGDGRLVSSQHHHLADARIF